MDSRRLLIFREVAACGSIAEAARRLGWTQPAVSQHLRALEREARCALVLRQARGVALTEAGRALHTHADAVAAQLRSAENEIAALANMQTGTVRLVAFPSAAATLVPSALATLARQHPQLRVQLDVAEPPHSIELVRSGDADVAMTFDHSDAPRSVSGNLATVDLGRDPVALVVARDHPVVHHRASDRLEALRSELWVAGCPRCHDHLHRVAGTAGFSPAIGHSTDDYVVAQALVANCGAVALLPHLALQGHRRDDVAVLDAPGLLHRDLTLLHHREATGAPAVQTVVEAITAAIRRGGPPCRRQPAGPGQQWK